MKCTILAFQFLVLMIALCWTIAAINEFNAGEINGGLASMAVVIGTGVFQIITIGTWFLWRFKS